MTRHRPARGAWVIAIAMMAIACSGGTDGSAAGVDPTPAAPTTDGSDEQTDGRDHGPDEHADMHHDDHEDHADHETSDPPSADDTTPPARTTEETLAALAAMDPDRLAGLHDHDDHDQHGDDHDGPIHPNGIDPERIVIPSIGVDADVIDLGLQGDGSMEVPTDFAQTGWFTPGPRPGRVGPAVIAGHVDSRDGPAVFYRLTDLEAGDEIEVHDDEGEVVTFVVRESEQVPKDDFPTERVYAGTPGPELRLITCGGIFDRSIGHYNDNIIVYAERVDV